MTEYSYSFNKEKKSNQRQLPELQNVNEGSTTQLWIKLVLSFLLFIPFPWWETQLFTPQVTVQMRKSTLLILTVKEKCRLWRKINTFLSTFSVTDLVFSIFWRNMYGPNLAEIDIKIFTPTPTKYTPVQIQYQMVFNIVKRFQKIQQIWILNKKQNYMIAFYKYTWFHWASFEYIFGAELDFFLFRFSFLLAGSSFWPKPSRMAKYLPVSLLVAVPLIRKKWVATEPFRVWPKLHSIEAERIELKFKWRHKIGSDRSRTEQRYF